MPLDHDRIKALFLAAIELPEPERDAFVRAHADDALRDAVLDLLRHHDGARADLGLTHITMDGEDERLPAAIGAWLPVALLGRGGMGVVYRARHERDGREAAIKLVATGGWSPVLLRRFRREIEVLTRLDHPGIARLLDHGTFAFAGGELPYLAVELVEGENLRTASARLSSPRERVALLASVCRAVGDAHARGVVHRDLKPENVLVDAAGRAKVLDFGVAGLLDRDAGDGASLTHTGLLLGTPQYMSPEQAIAASGTITPASDVYSLGVMAYELLGGRLPYDVRDVSLHRAMVAILTVEPPPLGSIAPGLSGDIEHILSRALEKDPAHRYRDASALAADLEAWLAGRPATARPTWSRRASRVAARHARGLRVGGLLALALTALVIAFASRRVSAWYHDRQLGQRIAAAELANQVIHRDSRNAQNVGEAQVAFEDLDRALSKDLGVWYHTAHRWTLFRIAECEMVRFGFDEDPTRLVRASDALRRADDEFNEAQVDVLPMGSDAFRYGCARDPMRSDVTAMLAGTYSEAARLSKPLTNMQLAVERARQSIDAAGRDVRELGLTPGDSTSTLFGRENSYGGVLIELGALTDSTGVIRRGLGIVQSVAARGGLRGDGMFQASVYENLGLGYLRLAERTREPALFDSARAGYRMSASIRTLARPFHFAEARTGIVETELEQAIASPDRATRVRHLNAARLEIGSIHERVTEAQLESLARRLSGLEAEVLARLGEETREPDLLEHASQVLLELANNASESHLVGAAWREYRWGLVAAARWRLQGRRDFQAAALVHFNAAHSLLPPGQDLRFAARLRAAYTAAGLAVPDELIRVRPSVV